MVELRLSLADFGLVSSQICKENEDPRAQAIG